MKRPHLTKLVVLLLAIVPLSAVASLSVATNTNAQVSITLALLALAGLAAVLTGGPLHNAAKEESELERNIRSTEALWRQCRKNKVNDSDLQSAICSVREYVAMEGEATLVRVLRAGASQPAACAEIMLDRAASVFPAAFQRFDSHGRNNHVTATARQFFTDVMTAAMHEQAVHVGKAPGATRSGHAEAVVSM